MIITITQFRMSFFGGGTDMKDLLTGKHYVEMKVKYY